MKKKIENRRFPARVYPMRRQGAGNDRVGLPLLGLTCLFLLASSLTANPLSLEEAVSTGLKNNYDIRMSRNTNQMARNNVKMGVGGLLPKADLSASVGKSYFDSSLVMPWEFEEQANATAKKLTAGLSWTLFDGFKMFYAYASLKENASLSSIKHRDKVEQTVVQIIQAYYNMVTQQALKEAAEQQLKISEARLGKVNMRRDMGAATRVELLSAQVAVNADRSQLHSAELSELIARNGLNLLMGKSHDNAVEVDDEIVLDDVNGSMDSWKKDAMDNNALLTIQQKVRRLEKYNRGMERANFLPVVALRGSYGLSATESDPGFSRDLTTAAVELSVTVPLFAGFRNVTAYQNSGLKLDNSKLSEEQYSLQLEALVYQQWETIQNAFKQVGYDTSAVELAETHLNLVKEQFDLGKATSVEFREAQLALLNARIRLATSKFKARIAVTELERMAGKIRID